MSKPLNIESFGAVGDGSRDNIEEINAALLVGNKQGQRVLVPREGVFAYSGVITADGAFLDGECDEEGLPVSTLYALNTDAEAIYLRGSGAGVRNLILTGMVPTVRTSPWETSRVVAREGATDWQMVNVHVKSSSAAGLVAEGASHGLISRCRVSDTLADAIHMTNASHHIRVADNLIERQGDDGIACVSYRPEGSKSAPRRRRLGTARDGDTGLVSDIVATNNVIRDQLGGRGMSVVGGERVRYHNNFIANVLGAAGLYIAQEDAWDTFGAHDVLVSRMTVVNSGAPDKDHPSVLIFSDGNDPNTDVTVQRLVISIERDNAGGIRIYGPCIGTLLDSNVIEADPRLRIDTPDPVNVIVYSDGPVGIL